MADALPGPGEHHITRIEAARSERGARGERNLAAGAQVALRLWSDEYPRELKPLTRRDYETVGFVLQGRAELHLEGEMVVLKAGDSWVVPRGAAHTYKILEPFSAIEATSPPANEATRAD